MPEMSDEWNVNVYAQAAETGMQISYNLTVASPFFRYDQLQLATLKKSTRHISSCLGVTISQ